MTVDKKVYEVAHILVRMWQPAGMEIGETADCAQELAEIMQEWLEENFPQ